MSLYVSSSPNGISYRKTEGVPRSPATRKTRGQTFPRSMADFAYLDVAPPIGSERPGAFAEVDFLDMTSVSVGVH